MRPSWEEYFMQMTELVASRATCDRKHVGALIVRDRRIIATGYNGSVKGEPHCDDAGHDMQEGHCIRTVHAEANAIAQAACYETSVRGADIYINMFPCWNCFKLIANSGIARIYFRDIYRDKDGNYERIVKAAQSAGIELTQVKERNES